MTRNIRVFLLTEAILAACGGFILPIYVLYFRCFRITLFDVALLAVIFEASILISEVPTGLFADRYGRRLSVSIGFALFAVSGMIFILFRYLIGFIIAEIVFGLAEAFISGAGEALAVDSIREQSKEPVLKQMYTLRSRIRIVMTAFFMLSAGYLFARSVSITFYPVLIGGLVGFAVSLFFIADRPIPKTKDHWHFIKPLKNMFRQVRLSNVLKIVFAISLVANFSFEGADQYWQVLGLELFNLNVNYFGLITAAGAVSAFFLVGRIVRRFSGNLSLPLLFLLLAGVVISSLPNSPEFLLPGLLIIYFFSKEMITPLFSVTINSLIDSHGRATFLSGYNLTCSIGEVISGVMVGLIASHLGLPVVFVVCGAVLVLFVIIALFLGRQPI
jgi:MFS family permease